MLPGCCAPRLPLSPFVSLCLRRLHCFIDVPLTVWGLRWCNLSLAGPVVLWSCGPLVLRSSGPGSSGPAVPSCDPLANPPGFRSRASLLQNTIKIPMRALCLQIANPSFSLQPRKLASRPCESFANTSCVVLAKPMVGALCLQMARGECCAQAEPAYPFQSRHASIVFAMGGGGGAAPLPIRPAEQHPSNTVIVRIWSIFMRANVHKPCALQVWVPFLNVQELEKTTLLGCDAFSMYFPWNCNC